MLRCYVADRSGLPGARLEFCRSHPLMTHFAIQRRTPIRHASRSLGTPPDRKMGAQVDSRLTTIRRRRTRTLTDGRAALPRSLVPAPERTARRSLRSPSPRTYPNPREYHPRSPQPFSRLFAGIRGNSRTYGRSGRTVQVGFLMRVFEGLRSVCGPKSRAVPGRAAAI